MHFIKTGRNLTGKEILSNHDIDDQNQTMIKQTCLRDRKFLILKIRRRNPDPNQKMSIFQSRISKREFESSPNRTTKKSLLK